MLQLRTQSFVAGHWLQGSGDRHVVVDKYDGRELARVSLADAQQMEAAIAAACVVRGELSATNAGQRALWLEHIGQELARRRDDFAQLLQWEAGKPIAAARAEVERGLLTLRASAAEATRFAGEVIPIDFGPGAGRTALSKRVPVGVVAAITPFNFPLNLALHKLGPAIAVGCPIVLKPAPQAPLSALLLAEVIATVGMPAGAVNVVVCAVDVAESLVRDERVALLSFTGSAAVGWRLKAIAGRKRVVLELGGNAPAIVDASADLQLAAQRLALSAYSYAGQSCISTQRIFVHQAVAKSFRAQMLQEIQKLVVGDPSRADVIVGPLIDRGHFERVGRWVSEAVQAGAQVLAGGKAFDAEHHVYLPTLLSEVDRHQKLSCEEVFGPVAILEEVDDFSSALRRCNESVYGLQAGVFTKELESMRQAHEQLEVGAVIINDASSFRVDTMPYGGVKQSGVGREGIRSAMEDMTEARLLIY